jgi:hypothetical protein
MTAQIGLLVAIRRVRVNAMASLSLLLREALSQLDEGEGAGGVFPAPIGSILASNKEERRAVIFLAEKG